MTGRRALAPVAALLGLAAVGLGACDGDPEPPGCQLGQQIAQPGTPLTLIRDARLDQVGNGFVLMGYDGQSVRWASVDLAGGLGVGQSAAVPPAAVAGPWFGVAGDRAPGDSVVIAYGVAAATPGDLDILVMAAPINGAAPVAAGPVVTLPDPSVAGGSLVAMRSGRQGMRAGLAWALPGQAQVNIQLLGGDGQPSGAPLTQQASGGAPSIECLSFVYGRDGLTVGYVTQQSAGDPNPAWTIVELPESGGIESSLGLKLGTVNPTCPLTAVTDAGYVVAWQNVLGSFIGVYDKTSNQFSNSIFAGAVAFGGSDLQPPLAGLGPAAQDYAVVLGQPTAAEALRVQQNGAVPQDALIFPSNAAQLGAVSSVPLSGAVYATYADYTTVTNGVGTAGGRFFVKVSCF